MRKFLLIGLALGAASDAASGEPLAEPGTANEQALLDAVKERLAPCFTLLGADPSIPVATTKPPSRDILASALLRGSGMLVSDGYTYTVLINGPSNAVYVLQYGGFAGSQAVFGPIPLATTCADKASSR